MSRIDENREFIPVRIAVLTVSDTRELAEDRSGDVLVARLMEAGHVLAKRARLCVMSAAISRSNCGTGWPVMKLMSLSRQAARG